MSKQRGKNRTGELGFLQSSEQALTLFQTPMTVAAHFYFELDVLFEQPLVCLRWRKSRSVGNQSPSGPPVLVWLLRLRRGERLDCCVQEPGGVRGKPVTCRELKSWSPHGKFPFKVWSSGGPRVHLQVCCISDVTAVKSIKMEAFLWKSLHFCGGSDVTVGTTVTDERQAAHSCFLPCSPWSDAELTHLLARILESRPSFWYILSSFVLFLSPTSWTVWENSSGLGQRICWMSFLGQSRQKIPVQILISSFRFQNETPRNKNTYQTTGNDVIMLITKAQKHGKQSGWTCSPAVPDTSCSIPQLLS